MRGRRLRLWICSALAFAGAATSIAPALAQTASSGQSSGIAYSIELQATIDPATAEVDLERARRRRRPRTRSSRSSGSTRPAG